MTRVLDRSTPTLWTAARVGRLPLSLGLALVASWAPPQPRSNDVLAPAILVQLEERVVAAADRALAATVGLKIRENRTEGDGSGVIVSEDGYILTVAHNFSRPGTRIKVYLPDGRVVDGVGLGRNERGDCALVKIDGDGPWPYANIGDSDALVENELCVMTGHAGGIVADRPAVVRVGTFTDRARRYWLQTDCAMMPGDSGGALFDLDGNVVGINSYIEQRVDRNFHVPVKSFLDDWERLAASENWNAARSRSNRESGALGLAVRTADGGVEVQYVFEGYRADEAGVQVGDLIIAVDGRSVSSPSSFRARERDLRVGETATLTIERDGERLEIDVEKARREAGEDE
ncbi:Putative serine protease HhoB precursor [Planctomycetes bacterium Pla163]|uniref:Serine protease HhoB n=1 Tax=Rohdeia mirabilis TaxID=2528008 RepID=A0A518CUQ0_9BACT|nr:Putative serine protease HhoB precursor [Planctomycetes bacterium Pla163]